MVVRAAWAAEDAADIEKQIDSKDSRQRNLLRQPESLSCSIVLISPLITLRFADFTAIEYTKTQSAVIQSAYRAPSDWTVIQNLLNEQHQARFLALNFEKQQLDGLLERLGADAREKRRELDEVRSRPDPIPPRREQTNALRIQLVMSGIPHAAFYETVDFRSDLPAQVRDRLEAQLMDAGLLDALIVPSE